MSETEEKVIEESVPTWGYLTFSAADRQPTYEETEQASSAIPDNRGTIQLIFPLGRAVPDEHDEEMATMTLQTTLDEETTKWAIGVIQRALFAFIGASEGTGEGEVLNRHQVSLDNKEDLQKLQDHVRQIMTGDFEELSGE